MNKKNITIDTDFFQDGVEAKLKQYHSGEMASADSKKASSLIEPHRKSSFEQSNHSYKYESSPDNEQTNQYQSYQMSSKHIMKLQAANLLENIISRAMANLFVSCWQELKGLLPQYSRWAVISKKQVEEDYNNVFNDKQQSNHNVEKGQTNPFQSQVQNQKKREIIERQKRGFTLDSLSKEKTNKSKSANKSSLKNNVSSQFKLNQSKDNLPNHSNQGDKSRISRKSYREKFMDYKHRSKSKQSEIQKYQASSELIHKLPGSIYEAKQGQKTNHYPGSDLTSPIRNVHSATNFMDEKNNLLMNINHLLMDREEIYKGNNYNYFINRGGPNNFVNYNYDTLSYQHPLNQFNQNSYKKPYKLSTQLETFSNQEEELLRAKIIEEIVEKLKYSRLRLEAVQKPKNEEQEILKKISNLQKLVLDFKKSEQAFTQIKRSDEQKNQILYVRQTKEQELYQKFIDQVEYLKAQIRDIKNLQQDYLHSQPSNPSFVDNSSKHLIIEQQKIISNYQRQYERLIKQKEKVLIFPNEKKLNFNEKSKTGSRISISNHLVQNGKNSEIKINFSGQSLNQEKKNAQPKIGKPDLNDNLTRSRRNQHLNRDEGFQKYRYTRTKILQNIGLRAQVEQEQKTWRESQIRMQASRQKREEEIRRMTQNVALQKVQQNSRKMPIRERYQQQWDKYRKSQLDTQANKNAFCTLFKC